MKLPQHLLAKISAGIATASIAIAVTPEALANPPVPSNHSQTQTNASRRAQRPRQTPQRTRARSAQSPEHQQQHNNQQQAPHVQNHPLLDMEEGGDSGRCRMG